MADAYRIDYERWKLNCARADAIQLPIDFVDEQDLVFEVSEPEMNDSESEEEEVVEVEPKRRRRSVVEKCPQAVSMEGATIHSEIDLSIIPVIPRSLPRQKIEPVENYANSLLLRERETELRSLGRWEAYLEASLPHPVRHVFKTNSSDRAEIARFAQATRKASDAYSKQLFVRNKLECARMAAFIHNNGL